jgi:regulation of enolase protein 1 (concanavalin A-like superfamily)
MNNGKYNNSDNIVEIEALAKTDYFVDLRNNINKHDAPFLYQEITGDFVAVVCVKPQFHDLYDAGGLFVYEDNSHWIKLEFENTDLGYPSIVSVITNGTSDDSNGEKMLGIEKVYLQVIRRNDYWVLHYSLDRKEWKMVRYFRLSMGNTVKVGMEAQSPIGNGTKVVFTDFEVGNKEIINIRKGI